MSATCRVLLVEDNPDDAELALRAFRKHELAGQIVVARDGLEALELLLGGEAGATGWKPDVVLLDLKVPKLDGIEVLRRIRADPRTARLPVVALTSSDEPRDIDACYALGVNSFVRKPVDFQRFVDVARQLALYWLSINQAPPAHAG